MKEEIEKATSWWSKHIHDPEIAKAFKESLAECLSEHYLHHWHVEEPAKGSGFRSVSFDCGRVDPQILLAASRIGLQDIGKLLQNQNGCTMIINPNHVRVEKLESPEDARAISNSIYTWYGDKDQSVSVFRPRASSFKKVPLTASLSNPTPMPSHVDMRSQSYQGQMPSQSSQSGISHHQLQLQAQQQQMQQNLEDDTSPNLSARADVFIPFSDFDLHHSRGSGDHNQLVNGGATAKNGPSSLSDSPQFRPISDSSTSLSQLRSVPSSLSLTPASSSNVFQAPRIRQTPVRRANGANQHPQHHLKPHRVHPSNNTQLHKLQATQQFQPPLRFLSPHSSSKGSGYASATSRG